MPQLHLPVKHTDDDLALAGALAAVLRSEELYVAWSLTGGPAHPVIPAALVEPAPEAETAPLQPRPVRRGLLGRILKRR